MAMHKCEEAPGGGGARPVGLSSAITVGSLLPVRVPVMRGTVLEALLWSDQLEVLVSQPAAGQELVWQGSRTVPRTYTWVMLDGSNIPGSKDEQACTSALKVALGVITTSTYCN
jgi:hypothetical protein